MLIPFKRAVILTACLGLIIGLGFLSTRYHDTAYQKIKTAVKSAPEVVNSFASTIRPTTPSKTPSHHHDWDKVLGEGKFAYVQYATDRDYLCNALINHARLRFLAVKYDNVLIYPKEWDDESKGKHNFELMRRVRREHPDIKYRPSELLISSKGETTWGSAITKFHAFELTEYTRVLAFDSDSLVLRSMDHYFQAPRAAIAVPRAYWLNKDNATMNNQVLGSHIMLLEPNRNRYEMLVEEAKASGEYDMEIVNRVFKNYAMILPHRGLALLTGEFRSDDHSAYLAGDQDDTWDAVEEAASAYMVHFSDWPLPKPWLHRSDAEWEQALPKCPDDKESQKKRKRRDCPDRLVWTGFYEAYAQEKVQQCQFLES